VMTHEIGHNFGAVHDVDDNTCGAGFIMDATLSPAATQFSACSIDEMTTSIEGLSNPSTCFEYPVDASIAARPDNPTTAGANEDFTVAFDVAEAHAAVAASELTLTGTLSGAAGSFTTAAVNGITCSVAGATYTCNTAAAGGLLEVTARVNGSGAMTVHANVAASASGSVKDIDPTNDAAAATVQAGTPPAAPTLLNAVAAANGERRIDLSWQDNSTNEDGFVVERRAGSAAFQELASLGPDVSGYSDATVGTGLNYTYRVAAFGSGGTSAPATSAPVLIAAPAKSNSGGGGGGAFGAELAPLLGLLLWRRRRTG
jgi:hypothetical protein